MLFKQGVEPCHYVSGSFALTEPLVSEPYPVGGGNGSVVVYYRMCGPLKVISGGRKKGNRIRKRRE